VSDWTTSLSTAIDIVKRLRAVNENIKNAEFSNLIADLNLELADLKLKLVGVVEENIKLREQIRELENVEGDPCPRCRKRTWELKTSTPHPDMAEMGVIIRGYECSSCGLSESKLVTPA
jgi:hypothetical protein